MQVQGFAGVHRSQPGLMEAYAYDTAHLIGAALALRIPRRPAEVPGDEGAAPALVLSDDGPTATATPS